MIPELNQSGVLPPFIRERDPTTPANMAPYQSTIIEFVSRYAQSPERIIILRGLLTYRQKLKAIGITEGFQWLDGSFVENVESNLGRPPADVDLVTFAMRPTTNLDSWRGLVHDNTELFVPKESKEKFMCDAYFVDLNTHPMHIVDITRFWFGLFSHQRESYLWKGMVQIPIVCADEQALEILEGGIGNV